MTSGRLIIIAIVLLSALTLSAFRGAGRNGFVHYDDDQYVTENPHVQAGLTRDSIRWSFTTTHFVNWHPLTWLSLQLDSQLFGLDPAAYHCTNVLLHLANTLLLFGFLVRTTGACWRSFCVAGLFAVHPLHVESVAWIAERKDVLSTFFGMLALWAYDVYRRRPSLLRYLTVAGAFALSLAAKPMLVTLPCVLLLLDYWPLRRLGRGTWKQLFLEKLPLFALSAASCVLTVYAMGTGGAENPAGAFQARAAAALLAYATYLSKTLWPAGLTAHYPHLGPALPIWEAAGAGLLLLAITAVVLRLARRAPYALVGWLWFVGTLVPVTGLVQILGGHLIADRYTYVPLIGLFLVASWGAAEVLERLRCPWPVRASLAALALAACALATDRQVATWHDPETLWLHALAVTESNCVAHGELALIRLQQGKLDEAKHHCLEALRVQPWYTKARTNLGLVLFQEGRTDEAAEQLEAALREDPGSVAAHNNLGLVRVHQGRLDEAVEQFRQALILAPYFPEALNNLGLTYLRQGKAESAAAAIRTALAMRPAYAEAHNSLGLALLPQDSEHGIAAFRVAVHLEPGNSRFHCNLAWALWQAGRREAALAEYETASRIDPAWPRTQARTAWMLATHPDGRLRDGALACRLAEQACQATAYQQPQLLDVLATALAETDRFEEAARTARQALKLRPDDEKWARQVEARLRDYESRRPFRDQQGTPRNRGS
jgi:tetratricopeptide (TPR) repeat protein